MLLDDLSYYYLQLSGTSDVARRLHTRRPEGRFEVEPAGSAGLLTKNDS